MSRRRSYQLRKLLRHNRKPAELLLVPMIDIFTVLVTFLLMTAVFSRTVILELKLPPANAEFTPPPTRDSLRYALGFLTRVETQRDPGWAAGPGRGPAPGARSTGRSAAGRR